MQTRWRPPVGTTTPAPPAPVTDVPGSGRACQRLTERQGSLGGAKHAPVIQIVASSSCSVTKKPADGTVRPSGAHSFGGGQRPQTEEAVWRSGSGLAQRS